MTETSAHYQSSHNLLAPTGGRALNLIASRADPRFPGPGHFSVMRRRSPDTTGSPKMDWADLAIFAALARLLFRSA